MALSAGDVPHALTIAASVLSAVIAASIIGHTEDADTSGRAIARMQTQIEHLDCDVTLHADRFERVFDRLRDLDQENSDQRRPDRGRASR